MARTGSGSGSRTERSSASLCGSSGNSTAPTNANVTAANCSRMRRRRPSLAVGRKLELRRKTVPLSSFHVGSKMGWDDGMTASSGQPSRHGLWLFVWCVSVVCGAWSPVADPGLGGRFLSYLAPACTPLNRRGRLSAGGFRASDWPHAPHRVRTIPVTPTERDHSCNARGRIGHSTSNTGRQ